MNKKLVFMSGILIIMLLTMAAVPVNSEKSDTTFFGRKHITAIGKFVLSDEDKVVYGHIFIGFIGIKPVVNLEIEFSYDNIVLIIMAKHFIHCVVKL
jgi:hypothetical protein